MEGGEVGTSSKLSVGEFLFNVGQKESEVDALSQGFISEDKECFIHWNRS